MVTPAARALAERMFNRDIERGCTWAALPSDIKDWWFRTAQSDLDAVLPSYTRRIRAQLLSFAGEIVRGGWIPDDLAADDRLDALRVRWAMRVRDMSDAFTAQSVTHKPCCSSHGEDMTCEKYRRTHFVEVRPCCSADAAALAAPRTEHLGGCNTESDYPCSCGAAPVEHKPRVLWGVTSCSCGRARWPCVAAPVEQP